MYAYDVHGLLRLFFCRSILFFTCLCVYMFNFSHFCILFLHIVIVCFFFVVVCANVIYLYFVQRIIILLILLTVMIAVCADSFRPGFVLVTH